jgi:hypothetical protein
MEQRNSEELLITTPLLSLGPQICQSAPRPPQTPSGFLLVSLSKAPQTEIPLSPAVCTRGVSDQA